VAALASTGDSSTVRGSCFFRGWGFYIGVVPQILGFHHVTMPTADALRSGDWYARVFGFSTVLVIEEESCVVAVLLEHPSGVRLYLREAPDQVGAWRGLGLLGLAVPDRDSLVAWDKYLSRTWRGS
jgi:catechol 2,3-dioxygenase-like lactoylglutathione lyase family enzyme